jgi:hypothetical protein
VHPTTTTTTTTTTTMIRIYVGWYKHKTCPKVNTIERLLGMNFQK